MSTFARPYFFEEHFPASYHLCFNPSVQRYPGELHMSPEAVEKKTQISKDNFEVYLNVKDFEPDEIVVKTVNETVIVEGKQKKRDKNSIPRHFIRYFRLPEFYDSEDVQSIISEDGILEIKAFPASQKNTKHLHTLADIVAEQNE